MSPRSPNRSAGSDEKRRGELYDWEGLSTEELAEVLGIPAGTVRSRLTRAREQIGRRMQEIARSPRLAAHTIEHFERWTKTSGDAVSSV